ncbi:MAG: metal ABC transporter permease, partial [Phascolarctobacterium sp.]|nr:metal ABC transporter permease [Candidatus Phascolarctobacterium equi]
LYGVLSVVGGLTISFYANLAPGGTIVLVATALFLLSLLLRAKPVSHAHHYHEECAECSHHGTVDDCGHVHHEHEEYQHGSK